MIIFSEKEQLFHLTNGRFSCVIAVQSDEEGYQELLLVHAGAPLTCLSGVRGTMKWHDGASFDSQRQIKPYLLPTEGRGDYRPVMLCAEEESGDSTTELYYTGEYTITSGKPALAGLPATYTEQDAEAETLTLVQRDPKTGLIAKLMLTVFADVDAMACSMLLENAGTETLTLTNASSFTLTLGGRWDMLHLHGGWARERHPERVPGAVMTRMIESTRGASGHQHNPFAALCAPDTTEFSGECYGVSLIYSGDFRIAADENGFGTTRLVAGLNPRTLRWQLKPGDTFQTPECVCAYSMNGLNGMSRQLHDLYRTRLVRGVWRDRERPVLINNWEATYFGFDHERILKIARTAAEVGVEMFVLDDGWFGKRDTDNCSLGDWVVDRRKLPRGMKALAEDINALGLRFGLWFEPEMVSPDSDLYRAHPDWCLHVPERRRTQSRQQLVLDMSRRDVQDYVIGAVSAVLSSAPIGYVKWDMNRNFKENGSALLQDGRGGELHHRYMLGVYRTMEAITQAFPEVLFESCSGGGGRFDAGLLYYMPQTWTSDDTDAIERMRIQYGTSYAYPASAMGAHVSAVPNHQVHRVTPIATRGDVAMGGNFGYELDLSAQTPEDLAAIREQIALVKRIRKTTQQGTFTRLLSPFEGYLTAWQFADDERVLLFAGRSLAMPNQQPTVIRLYGLPAGAVYRDAQGNEVTAAVLEKVGIAPALPHTDFATCVVELVRVK